MWLFESTGFWLIFGGCVIGLIALIGYAACVVGGDVTPPEWEGPEVHDERSRPL